MEMRDGSEVESHYKWLKALSLDDNDIWVAEVQMLEWVLGKTETPPGSTKQNKVD